MADSTPALQNTALDDCDEQCVPVFYKNTNTSVQKRCSEELLSDTQCFRERPKEDSFYKVIHWNRFIDNLDSFQSYFESVLMSDLALCEDIVKQYTFGPYPPESNWGKRRPETYAVLDLNVQKNDDFQHCKNILLKLYINRGIAAKGKKKQVISHISLHPRLPKYYRDTRRSRSGCGYYKKLPTNTATDISPFQYTIETVKWGMSEFRASDPMRPFVPLYVNPEDPGSFLPLALPFSAMFQEHFPNGPGTSMSEEEKIRLNSIHTRIVNHFINTWNTVFLKGTNTLPALRNRSSGGKRKTRKRKH